MFKKYASNKHSYLTEAEAACVYKQVEQGREISPIKLQCKSVWSMNSKSENIWFHTDTDTEEVILYKEVMMNKFERHNIDLSKPEMNS